MRQFLGLQLIYNFSQYLQAHPLNLNMAETTESQPGSQPAENSLYDFTVPVLLQTVTAVRGFLDRAVAHCKETATNPDDFVSARLFPDMAPFHFQIECIANHSVCTMEAIKNGTFSAPDLVGAIPFADLQARIASAEAALKAFTREEIDSQAGKVMDSMIGPRHLVFTSEDFFLSWGLHNFFFHAVTAYNILRTRGVPLGKADFEGQMRTLKSY